jgi:hypothetical protein
MSWAVDVVFLVLSALEQPWKETSGPNKEENTGKDSAFTRTRLAEPW